MYDLVHAHALGEINPARVSRRQLDTFEITAAYDDPDARGICDLALAPDAGTLFILSFDDEENEYLRALGTPGLAMRFTVPAAAFEGRNVRIRGLAVCGDALAGVCAGDATIRMLSLDGEPRRVINLSFEVASLYSTGGLLFALSAEVEQYGEDYEDNDGEPSMLEVREKRCIVVLTPEGDTLQEYRPHDSLLDGSLENDLGYVATGHCSEVAEQAWCSVCALDGKLFVHEHVTWMTSRRHSHTNRLIALTLSVPLHTEPGPRSAHTSL